MADTIEQVATQYLDHRVEALTKKAGRQHLIFLGLSIASGFSFGTSYFANAIEKGFFLDDFANKLYDAGIGVGIAVGTVSALAAFRAASIENTSNKTAADIQVQRLGASLSNIAAPTPKGPGG